MKAKKIKRKEASPVSGTDKVPQKKNIQTRYPRWMPVLLAAITFLSLIPVLKAEFVNWDDNDYVLNNIWIRDFSNLDKILFTPLQGNYHPLTVLSLAFNYAISGLEPWSYHLVNLLLHIFNVFLVFSLIFKLTKGNQLIAFVTAILFGIHPMHVESVAWISERKDVLYGCFFLGGLIKYHSYLESNNKKELFWVYVLFLCSILSKPAAIIFPVALITIDLFKNRGLSLKLFLEKLPFFVISIVSALLTFMAQSKQGSTMKGDFSWFQSFAFASYGFMMYLVKAIFPFQQAAFYPYPASVNAIPAEMYLGIPVFMGLIAYSIYTYRKNNFIHFGISFFIVNLLLVLQFISVGSAIMADRYTYIPYIGLFFIAGYLLDKLSKRNPAMVKFILIPVIGILSILTYRQSLVWNNSKSLWDQAIENHPSARAYNSRATILRKEKDLTRALEYYDKAILINNSFEEAYNNKANVLMELGRPAEAFAHYTRALKLKPDYVEVLDNLGSFYGRQENYDSALFYLNKAIALNPNYKEAFRNRGLVHTHLGKWNEAARDFESFLFFEPDAASSHNSRGVCYMNIGDQQKAIESFSRAIELSPDPYYFLNRAYSFQRINNIEAARRDVQVARQSGLSIDNTFLQSLGLQ